VTDINCNHRAHTLFATMAGDATTVTISYVYASLLGIGGVIGEADGRV
jgi:hypothetical protein